MIELSALLKSVTEVSLMPTRSLMEATLYSVRIRRMRKSVIGTSHSETMSSHARRPGPWPLSTPGSRSPIMSFNLSSCIDAYRASCTFADRILYLRSAAASAAGWTGGAGAPAASPIWSVPFMCAQYDDSSSLAKRALAQILRSFL